MRSLLGRFHRPNARSQSERLFILNNLGDGSTLSLDFTTGVLDSRLTFTRASTTATYINSNGYVTTAGTNVPRFDHDPTTLAPRGLLVEGQATNLLNWSESFATSGGTNNNWADTSITRTTGQADPANGTTAIRFTASAGNATVISSAAIGSSAARTFSVWLRRVSGTGNIQYTQNNGTNWTTQAITSTWTRYSFTHTVYHRVGIRIVTSGDAIEMWGAQLETGSGASSYIPTGASQVTRNADNCEILDLTTIGFNANAGTIYTDVGTRLNTGSQRNYTFLPASGSNNQIFEGSGLAFNVYSSGSFVAQIGTSAIAAQKIAAAYAVNDYAVSVAGGAVATDTLGAVPSSLTKLTIGGSIVNAAAYMNGCVRVFKYWPTRLDNATLQSLTL